MGFYLSVENNVKYYVEDIDPTGRRACSRT